MIVFIGFLRLLHRTVIYLFDYSPYFDENTQIELNGIDNEAVRMMAGGREGMIYGDNAADKQLELLLCICVIYSFSILLQRHIRLP